MLRKISVSYIIIPLLFLLFAGIGILFRNTIRIWIESWLFSSESIIDFLSVCIGMNAASSFERFQASCLAPIQNTWQERRNALQLCLDEFSKNTKKLSKKELRNIENATLPSKEMQEMDKVIDRHTGIINHVSYILKMMSRACVFLCILLTIPSQAQWLTKNRFILILFLFPPFSFYLFILLYWLLLKCSIDNKLKAIKDAGCSRLHSCTDLVKNIQNLKSKKKA